MSDITYIGPIHHVGVAVRKIETAANDFARAFGAVPESDIVVDEAQQVRIQFVMMNGARLELLEPADPSSHLWGIVNRGIGVYHTCHETHDLDAALKHVQEFGAKVISPPKPAVAFGGRRVAFTMCRGMMVEFVEAVR